MVRLLPGGRRVTLLTVLVVLLVAASTQCVRASDAKILEPS